MKVRETRHVSVMLEEVLRVLSPRPGKIIVDCTLGLGGHSAAILRHVAPKGTLLATDMDAANIALAQARLDAVIAETGGDFTLFHVNFAALPAVLQQAGVEKVDGILADLGVASPQIDDPARGFSYRQDGPLDMRMNPTRGQQVAKLLAKIGQRELEKALLELGDEEDAAKIARLIVRRREEEPIVTTQRLAEIVCEARDFTPARAAGAKLHPAARTFQALRILVNEEMKNLERLLDVIPQSLKPRGVACIISFHSGEDRRVKLAFKEGLRAGVYAEVSTEPILAGDEEIEVNPRSRSAKLRWARMT